MPTLLSRLRFFCVLGLLLFTPMLTRADPLRFNIAAQPMVPALKAFAEQSNMQLLYKHEAVEAASANAVVGNFDRRTALEQLVRDTGLEIVFTGKDAATIRPRAPAVRADNTGVEAAGITLAQAGSGAQSVPGSGNGLAQDDSSKLEEVIVTGTHIRGAEPVGAEVVKIDRTMIERSGRRTTEEILNLVPQNFKSHESEEASAFFSTSDSTRGSSANLRGLGSQSTLTLLNGRRLPTAGAASFVDLSMIPASALQRVDVLLDGASAQYGSDAVGGVVNLVLRNDYQGAETAVQGGYAAAGGASEKRLSQVLGGKLGPVNGLLSYEYYDRDPVLAKDREELITIPLPDFHLLPKQRRQSLLYSANYQPISDLTIRSTGMYSDRHMDVNLASGTVLTPIVQRSDVVQYGASLAAAYRFGRDWQTSLSGDFGKWSSDILTMEQSVAPERSRQQSHLNSAEFNADGTVVHLPGGPLKLALGSGLRSEELDGGLDTFKRHIKYGFAEILVPVVGAQAPLPLVRSLNFSASMRYEDYSDFGSATSPRFGFEWEPIAALHLRGSYGKAFRAPTLDNLNDAVEGKFIFNLPNGTGLTKTLLLLGNNANLGPEKSKSWNVGFDLAPQSFHGIRLSGTYYDIDYLNRIASVPLFLTTALTNPQFAPIVTRRSGASDPAFDSLVAYYFSRGAAPRLLSGCSVPLTPAGVCTEPTSDIGAIGDFRLKNVTAVHTTGVDLQISYLAHLAIGDLDSDINIGRIFSFDQRLTSASPQTSPLDTYGNPLNFRARVSSGLVHGPLTVSGAVNYSDGYATSVSASGVPMSSWTTVDLFLGYEFGASGLNLSLSGNNVFNKAPPVFPVVSSVFGVHYDAINASPLGRFLSLQLRKTW